MKCPSCGKWNRASLPHCFFCGEPLDVSHAPTDPAWREDLKDKGRANAYIRVNEQGDVESARIDPRDALAHEMMDFKSRKEQGAVRKKNLREIAEQRESAPAGRTVRTTSNRSSFFSSYDDPVLAANRPEEPDVIEPGVPIENIPPVYTERYRVPSDRKIAPRNIESSFYDTQRQPGIREFAHDPSIYDGFSDTSTSAYLSLDARQDEYENALRMPVDTDWKPPRRGLHKIAYTLLIIIAIAILGWIGYTFVLPMLTASQIAENREVMIVPSIREDLAAHTITIPGKDGQRITIRELRTSAIVTGGVATFDILDHIWYDNFEEFLQESMPVTLTPYLMTETGKQQPLEPIHYEIDIPLSPIDLNTPDAPYKVVSTAMYNIVFFVREGSQVSINGQDYSDLVNTEGGRVSYNATVQPIGENHYDIVVRSQYCRENTMTVTLYREKQDIPLDLASDIASRSTESVITVRASTLPGAVVKVLSPYTDLDITNTAANGSFTFKATFEKIGTNLITITADYPGKKTTIVEHEVYYVPNIDVYSRRAWDIVTEYTDLMNNLDLRKAKTQIYVCKGIITAIDTTKPQRAFMNCGTEESPIMIYVENSSRTTWVEGEWYRLYADAYGMYDSKPWLVVRYTYTAAES